MNIRDAESLARHLMFKHGLIRDGWSFDWSQAKTMLGKCSHRKRVIYLSEPITRSNDEARVKDTILHEIAHALVGHGHGHNHIWRAKAISIGCSGSRCGAIKPSAELRHRYTAVCPNCEHEYKYHRYNSKVACGMCRTSYDENCRLVWIDNR